MRREVDNRNKNSEFNGDYAGRDLYVANNIIMFQDSEREFVVTHNANIKPVSYFTGRETELENLRQRIEDGRKSVLVSGMGGIGKTHICRKLFEEYLNKHTENGNGPFRYMGYIEYAGDMNSSLINCLKYKEQDDPEQNQEAAWRELEYLAADGKLLLFVDNVNVTVGDDAGLERLKQIPGAVVLTSRRTSFSKEFEPYRIGFLGTEQCKEIYERIRYEDSGKKVPEEEISDLEYFIENMAAGHTITVEFLAHLAQTKHWTAKELRNELEGKGFRFEYKDEEDRLINIQEEYEKLYDLSKLTEAEKNILEAFSVFPYISLEAEICNKWLFADAGVSEGDGVLVGLYRKGWLQFDVEQESYSMHPVFAQFIYDKCKPLAEKHHGLIEACRRCLEVPENGSAIECKNFIPFAENIIEKIGMERDMEQVQLMNILAYLLWYIGEFQKAEVLYKKNLKIEQNLHGEEHPSTAMSYNNLAGVYNSQGEYKKAEELYKKGLRVREKVLGEEHPDNATSYNNLAGVYESQGEYKKAEELYKKGLVIREKVLGEEHPSTATIYNNLAGVYESQGEYKKAEELYKKGLVIREKVLGEEHPSTATIYNNLAGVYKSQGEYKKAEELYKKGLGISEKVLGEEHLDTATIYNNLASAYESQGEYKKAQELYKKGLRIREKVLGEKHPDTATIYNNLAGVYKSQGEYKKAEELYKKGLGIREKVLGEEHPSTAASYNNLAVVYMSQGEYKKAEELYKKGLHIREKVLGEEHPDTAASYNNLAGVYESQGEYKKAEELYKKGLRIREKILGEEHPSTAASYNNLAGVYESQGEYKIAITYYLKAYNIFLFKLGINHPNTQIVYENMKITYFEWNPENNFDRWLEERMKGVDVD